MMIEINILLCILTKRVIYKDRLAYWLWMQICSVGFYLLKEGVKLVNAVMWSSSFKSNIFLQIFGSNKPVVAWEAVFEQAISVARFELEVRCTKSQASFENFLQTLSALQASYIRSEILYDSIVQSRWY